MSKLILVLWVVVSLSGCAAFHDGSGWEHDMNSDSSEILEHKH
ncbi:MAG: hypothetical protein Q9N67_03590 [Ghiorsea sp.]|nr:hypothetical protein [Ghiorsea sp.]MDQ7004040.1 hypothetical protein [Ghiorsea sp.]